MQQSRGFRSLTTERENYEPAIEGSIPDWLSGTLVRNGPGRFEAGGERVNHWFDGLAMLRRYAFEDGTVSYTNRFLRTGAYDDAMDGELTGQFATDTRSGWQRFRDLLTSLGPPAPTDNANVHVARIDGEYVALTEAPRRVAFDPETLETRDEFTFEDDLTEHIAAAHLVDDPHRNEVVGFSTQFGRTHQYNIYRVSTDSRERDRIASLEAQGPAYIHDCSVTAEHVVIVESPLVLSVLRSLSPFSQGPADMLDWRPDQQTRILVVDRDTGELVAEPTVGAAFAFHHVNAYLEDGTVVLDLVEFPDGDIVDAMSMEALDGEAFPDVPDGRLVRYRIDLATDDVTRSRLYDGGLELPRVRGRPSAESTVMRTHRQPTATGQTDWSRSTAGPALPASGGSGRPTSRNRCPSSDPAATPRTTVSCWRRRSKPTVTEPRCSCSTPRRSTCWPAPPSLTPNRSGSTAVSSPRSDA